MKKLLLFFLLCCIGVGLYLGYDLLRWMKDSYDNQYQLEKIYEVIQPTNHKLEQPIDWNYLKKINSEVVGWITVNNTNINYPIVQHDDNSYYLSHSIDQSKNRGGWIFMDYRNNSRNLNRNTIIYGHDRADKSMFATLKNVLKEEWYTNKENQNFTLWTTNKKYDLQVFSVYKIPTTTDYLQTDFSTLEDYQVFLNLITDRSIYDFQARPSTTDKIVTLSSCFNDYIKVVLHAKIV